MMDAQEVHALHESLKSELSKLFLDFAEKHSPDTRPNGHQAFCIIQSVLCEFQSNMEYQTGRMAPFTTRQIDHICYQIGGWYLMMKPLLEGQHNLGHMKEKLKIMICGE